MTGSLSYSSTLRGFEEFCGSNLWDIDLTWYPDNGSLPDITPCMEKVGLIWAPCTVFWLPLPLYIYILKANSGVTMLQPLRKLSLIKMVLPVLLVCLCLYEFFSGDLTPINILSSVLLSLTLCAAAVLVRVYLRLGQYSSGLLWCYWLVALLAACLNSYISIKRFFWDGTETEKAVITSCIKTFLFLLGFILSSVSDAGDNVRKHYEKTSPELVASFPSFLMYQWLQPVLSTGHRKRKEGSGLERSELYYLPPVDRVRNFFPEFEGDWNERIRRWRQSSQPEPACEASSVAGNIQECDEATPLIAKPSKSKGVKQLSLAAVIFRHWLPILLFSWIMRMVITAMGFVNPLIQGYLISFMASQGTAEAQQLWKGLTVCVVVLVASLFQSVTSGMCRYLEYKAYVRIYSSLLISIYKKSLTMNGTTKQDTTTGEIVNLMSIDTGRTTALIYEAYVYFYVPVQSSIALYMLYQLLGNAAFAGLGIIAVSAPATLLLASVTQKLRKIAMEVKDQRIKLMNETLNAIKIIKLYAWEPAFQTRICELRQKEIRTQMKLSMLNCVFYIIYAIIPTLVTIVVFSIYTATTPDHILTPSVAFVSLSLINILRDGLNHVPHSIAFIVECLVSYRRILRFFKTEDIDAGNVSVSQSANNPIEVECASFSHLPDKPKVLQDINLTVKEGSLTAVVGAVGAGKSSLLAAFIGDLYKHQGSVTVKGSVALVAQQAFILNGSVRDNILFGSEFKTDRYNEVVEACALTKDFEVLANGDQTAIGEKGINLSGGQKQRISLARAVYNDADVYLLDDPLSAVDAHVGKHIFDYVIGPEGLLKQKTRFMVTHGIHWLPLVQEVYVMKKGRIAEHGTYESLLSQEGEFAEFLKTYFLNEEAESSQGETEDTADEEGKPLPKILLERLESITSTGSSEEAFNELLKSAHPTSATSIHSPRTDATTLQRQASDQLARLLSKEEEEKPEEQDNNNNNVFDEEEEVGKGTVSWRVYFTYLQAIGWKRITPLSVLIVLAAGAPIFTSIWLSKWTGDPIFLNTTISNDTKAGYMQMYLTVFSLSGVVGALLILAYIVGSAYCFYIASGNLHNQLLNRILKAKMAFFDTKPLGMILNRFSKDVDTMDDEVGWSLMSTVDTSIEIIASLAGIIYATNVMVIPIIAIAACYYLLQRYFLSTARQTRRLKSKAASPIYSHFSETLAGSQTIRAYRQQERFVETNVKHVEECNIYTYFERFVDGWLDVRMKCMGGLMVFATSLFCVLSTQIPFLQNLVTPSIAGLVLSLTFSVTGSLKGFVWIMVWAETSIVAVERIMEYSVVEQEASWDGPTSPSSEWPTSGLVKFTNYATRYRPELDLVINGLSIEVQPREKIGIVGRTGAGKSSLTLSLFRLIEAAEGNITIDGVDIANIGLHDLRNNITILPQDPILFSGSVRENLDPFAKCSDGRLWQVLEQCQLKEFVSEQPEELSADCGEGGQNLSVGQRQLICLARALLRKTKILVMDEATAAVDLKTDDFIQKTIRSQFSDCTILTIAHRLNTIIDSDRVLVMEQGNVAEFGSPQDLLANEKSVFHGMAKEAGIL